MNLISSGSFGTEFPSTLVVQFFHSILRKKPCKSLSLGEVTVCLHLSNSVFILDKVLTWIVRWRKNLTSTIQLQIKLAFFRTRTVWFSLPCLDTGFGSHEDSPPTPQRIFIQPKTCILTRRGKWNCPLARNRTFNCITEFRENS